MRMQVGALASFGELRTQCCHELRLSSDPMLLLLLATAAPMQPLAWQLPYAMAGPPPPPKKKKGKKKKPRSDSFCGKTEPECFLLSSLPDWEKPLVHVQVVASLRDVQPGTKLKGVTRSCSEERLQEAGRGKNIPSSDPRKGQVFSGNSISAGLTVPDSVQICPFIYYLVS